MVLGKTEKKKFEEESLEHLLFHCKDTEVFWKEVLSWLATHRKEILNFSLIDVLFGKFDIEKDFMVINHVLNWKVIYL